MDAQTALRRILRPIARFALTKGLRYQDVANLLKQAFVDAARGEEGADAPTISRLSLRTGLQRRDVQSRLDAPPDRVRPTPLARVLSLWPNDRAVLEKAAVEALIRSISTDLHPRTLIDELLRLKLISEQSDGYRIESRTLVAPADDALMVQYFAQNCGDHLSAAAANLAAAPETGPYLDQALHYSALTKGAAETLQSDARALGREVLLALQTKTETLRSAEDVGGPVRIRFGVYFYAEEDR